MCLARAGVFVLCGLLCLAVHEAPPDKPVLIHFPGDALATVGSVHLRHADATWLSFTPKGDTLISAGVDSLCFWDVKTGKERRRLALKGRIRPGDKLHSWTLSPDGKLLMAVCRFGPPFLWDMVADKELPPFPKEKGQRMTTAAIAPDSSWLVTEDEEGSLNFWDVSKQKLLRTLKADADIGNLVLSPDAKHLAFESGWQSHVEVWDVAGGTRKSREQQPNDRRILLLGFSADGAVLGKLKAQGRDYGAAQRDGWRGLEAWMVQLSSGKWDGGREGPFSGEAVSAVAHCAKTNTLATHGVGGVIRVRQPVWKYPWQGDEPRETRRILTDVPMASAMAFSSDGALLALADRQGLIQLWDVQSGTRRAMGSTDRAEAAAFLADGKTLATFGGGRIVHYEPGSGRALRSFNVPNAEDPRLIAPPGTHVATVGKDRIVREWDLATGQESFRAPAGLGYWRAISPDGRRYVEWGETHLGIFNFANGEQIRRLKKARRVFVGIATLSGIVEGPGERLVFSGDGRQLAFSDWTYYYRYPSEVRTLQVWDLTTGTELWLRKWPSASWDCYHIAFAQDGRQLAVAGCYRAKAHGIELGPGFLAVLDAATGKEIRRFDGHDATIKALAFSPDGKMLAAADVEPVIRLWDIASGKELRRFRGHNGGVISQLAFSPDGKLLVSVDELATALVWDCAVRPTP